MLPLLLRKEKNKMEICCSYIFVPVPLLRETRGCKRIVFCLSFIVVSGINLTVLYCLVIRAAQWLPMSPLARLVIDLSYSRWVNVHGNCRHINIIYTRHDDMRSLSPTLAVQCLRVVVVVSGTKTIYLYKLSVKPKKGRGMVGYG